MTAVLRTQALVQRFGAVTAVRDVSIALARGARHALIGPNGAGKTTLVNLLGGALAPTAGRIELDGRDITALPADRRVARGLVRTFQVHALFDSLSPRRSLQLAVASRRGVSWRMLRPLAGDRAVAREADALLQRFGLEADADRPTRALAYGRRRLLDIALALALEPRVLLLDEPAAGVPAGERHGILEAIAALPPDVAVLLIEHDMDLVFGFAQRITVMAEGAVVAEGTPAEIAADATVRAVYLGDADAAQRDG